MDKNRKVVFDSPGCPECERYTAKIDAARRGSIWDRILFLPQLLKDFEEHLRKVHKN